MARRADLTRTDQARRAGIRKRLVAGGMDPTVADRWCAAWETEAALQGHDPAEAFWDAGERWIDAQCAARRRPPD